MDAALKADKQEGLDEFWKKNLGLLSWMVLLFFGGSLLGIYYASIGYFPEIDWQASLSYLFAMSAIGLIMLVIYGLLLFVPGWIWSEALVHHYLMEETVCREDESPRKGKVFVIFGFPFILTVVAAHWALATRSFSAWSVTMSAVIFSAAWVCRALCGATASRIPLSSSQKGQKTTPAVSVQVRKVKINQNEIPLMDLIERLGFFELSLLSSIASLAAIHYLAAQDPRKDAWMLAICSLVMVVANFLVAIYFRDKRRTAVVCAVASAFLLLVLGNILVTRREAQLPCQILRLFGVGSGQSVTLILTKEAAEVVKLEDIPFEPIDHKDGAVKVEAAEILSRLGSEYFLHAYGKRFSLPKAMVLSWSVDDTPKEQLCPLPFLDVQICPLK
ncbi:MAG TPA: hypothetical protein VF173_19625 [Thermoanaerobaculia bacterium]|nr:hypothetical protein [Thermoanaerobaculia bacterium]